MSSRARARFSTAAYEPSLCLHRLAHDRSRRFQIGTRRSAGIAALARSIAGGLYLDALTPAPP